MAEEEGGLWGVSGTFTAPGGGGRGEAEIRASEPPGARRAQVERSGSPSWREPTQPTARSQPRGCTQLLPLISLASFVHSTLVTLGPRCSTVPVAAPGLICPTARGLSVPLPGREPQSPALEGGFFLLTAAAHPLPERN